jgi:hypothetical protein
VFLFSFWQGLTPFLKNEPLRRLVDLSGLGGRRLGTNAGIRNSQVRRQSGNSFEGID